MKYYRRIQLRLHSSILRSRYWARHARLSNVLGPGAKYQHQDLKISKDRVN